MTFQMLLWRAARVDEGAVWGDTPGPQVALMLVASRLCIVSPQSISLPVSFFHNTSALDIPKLYTKLCGIPLGHPPEPHPGLSPRKVPVSPVTHGLVQYY